MLFEPPDRPRPHLLHQPVDDLDAREVALVHGAIECLAGEGLAVQRPVGIAIEEATDLVFQLLHPLDGLGDQGPGQLLMRQPFAAFDGIHEMALDGVAGIKRDVVAALHHAGAAAFAEQTFADDGDVEIGVRLQRMQRGKQPGAAGAEDQNVGLEMLDIHSQNTRARNMKATMADTAAASVASRFWPSRQSRFSITKTRKPPSRCTVSRKTSPPSANFTSGRSVQRKKLSSFASPSMARPSARKCSGRKIAKARPDSRCTKAAIHSALPRCIMPRAITIAPRQTPRAHRAPPTANRIQWKIVRRGDR